MSEKEWHGFVEAQIQTIIEEIREDRKQREEWRKCVEARFTPLENFVDKVDTPLKVMVWSFVAVVGSALATAGAMLVDWLRRHWHS